MKVVYFTHSLRSCWNHGNAHFLRGVLSELQRRGHRVTAFEPRGAWSLTNLLADHSPAALQPYHDAYPNLAVEEFGPDIDFASACDGADLVIVHEWNDPSLVAALGRLRASGGRFLLLFHDTHHRAVSESAAMGAYALEAYDGILAFGETLAAVYRDWGWGSRAFTWHEAADTRIFHPPLQENRGQSVVWIGNWGDGERSRELENFLFKPVQEVELPLTVYGVRYPPEALALLRQYGVAHRGWLANVLAPGVFAQHMTTIHIPRQFYASHLQGIPTIRVFEALACGIPLLSAPWTDSEGLFTLGSDFLMAKDGAMMKTLLRDVQADPALRRDLAMRGLQTIRARHTCAHRVDELLAITARLTGRPGLSQEAAG